MIIEKLNSNYLAVTGILLPYVMVIMVTIIVSLFPYATTEQKWQNAGELLVISPFGAVIFGAILVGVNTVIQDIKTGSERNRISGFLFSFIWTSIFNFFVAIYIFMQFVYINFGGLQH